MVLTLTITTKGQLKFYKISYIKHKNILTFQYAFITVYL